MRSGKELILATKPYAKEIRWKSWFFTITTLIILIGSLIGAVVFPHFLFRLFSGLFAGLVMVRFFVIYHDHQHHAILPKSGLADVLFTLYGFYILAPTSIWKRSHDYHHNHNSKLFSASIGSYPIMTRQKFLSADRSEKRVYLLVRSPFSILFGYISMFLFGMCVQSFLSSPRRHWDSLLAIVLHIAAAVCWIVFGGWQIWITAFVIPYLVADMIGAYLFYAQHNFPGVKFRGNTEWSYAGAALESSSYMKMNFFWRWVTANIGYHHIHHINSRIPFYRLPEVMNEIPEMKNVVETSLWPADIIACLKLKIWDPDRNKMIPLSELK